MQEETSFGFVMFVLMVVLLGIALVGDYWFNSWKCNSKFGDYKPTYGLIQGCMIEYNGKKIPAENFRLVD